MTAFFEHLQYAFFQNTLLACLLVGVVCGVFSTYVVLRRLVFAGVALTQLSSAGLGLAAVSGLTPVPTSLATTILGVGLLALVQPGRKTRTDNLIALLYIGGWAASVLLFAVAQRGDSEMTAILYGDILGVLPSDIWAFLPVAAVVLTLLLLVGKELVFTSFDPETAGTYRLPVWLYDLILFVSLGVVIVFATKMLGLLLVFAFLVAPGTAALMVCRRMGATLWFAAGFTMVMSVLGLWLAAGFDLPPGPGVTAAGLLLLGVVAGCKAIGQPWCRRREGCVSRWLDSDRSRVVALVLALVLVAIVAGAVSPHLACERTEAVLSHGHHTEECTPCDHDTPPQPTPANNQMPSIEELLRQ
jgi:ABC-type Mn2+/Zn2+ transport system permease subunit